MKLNRNLVLVLTLVGLSTSLVGCIDEETKADPAIIQARDKQRAAMDPGRGGPGGATAPSPNQAPSR